MASSESTCSTRSSSAGNDPLPGRPPSVAGFQDLIDERWPSARSQIVVLAGDVGSRTAACRGHDRRARRQRGARVPPRRALRHDAGHGREPESQRRRHAQRLPARRGARRDAALRELDRGCRRLQGLLPRGHVRRGAEAQERLLPDQVPRRETGARRMPDALSHLPPWRRGRILGRRGSRQDRRHLLRVQVDPTDAPDASQLVPPGRLRRLGASRRAGRLRRPGHGRDRTQRRLRPATRSTSPTRSRRALETRSTSSAKRRTRRASTRESIRGS